MKIIPYREASAICNLESLSRGAGARYMECTIHDNEQGQQLIAYKWRRKLPAGIPDWHIIINYAR